MGSIPVFLPGEFHGQRCLVVYSPWGYNESDTTEWLSLNFTYFPHADAEPQGPSCWVTFLCVHSVVFRVPVTSHVRGHVTAQEVWIWDVVFAFSSSVCWIMFLLLCFLSGSAGKESAFSAGDLGSIPGLGRSPGEGKSYPLQYSDLENSMDCIVLGIAESDMIERLSLHFTA